MRNEYTFSEFINTLYSLVLTRLFYRGARLIRRPFFLRGKSSLVKYVGLTTGHHCRFDLPGGHQKTLIIGKYCEIGDNVHIVAHEKVVIGDNCLMASKIFISDTNHGKYSGSNQTSPEILPNNRVLVTNPVLIGNNVWIGENVCILSGTRVGNGCIIAANALVNKDVPDNCIVAGIPAKVIKKWDPELKLWTKYF